MYLIIAGELIFALPFHINRFFRPSLLEELQITNSMMGIAFTVYGLTALICYFPGGYIADRFDPRKLLSISLFLTSLGGIVLLYYPSFILLCLIYGYWGVTSILFCWSALIKATRIVGKEKQGLSFGVLEAGRGFIASIAATIAALLFSSTILKVYVNNLFTTQFTSLSIVIFFYTSITLFSSIIIWFFYKTEVNNDINISKKMPLRSLLKYYKIISCQALIVFSAYSAYKGIDYYSQYFYEVLKYSKEKTAFTMSNLSYLRPICAITAGIIADRITTTKSTFFLFVFSTISFLILSIWSSYNSLMILIIANLTITMVAIFSLRGIYFSFFKETNIPINMTGITVGIISLIGFFPDVYIGPLFGVYLDKYPVIIAFQKCFFSLFLISLAGLCSAYYILMKKRKQFSK